MKKIILICILALTTFQIAVAQVEDKKAREILDQVSAKAKLNKSMKFDFSYTMVDPKHKINETLKGSILMQGQKFNLSFMGRTIMSDGITVWTYDANAEEVQISNVDPKNDALNPGKLLTSYDKTYKSKLIKTETINGKVVYVIDLTPTTAKAFYKIRLTIDKLEMRVLSGIVYNKDNVTYTYTVSKFTANVAVSDDLFKFNVKKYPDVEVIDLR